MGKKMYELAVIGRATWDLHSLNNEGSIGNVTEPRTVLLSDGSKADGVSGEMLKHMHVHTLWHIGRNDLKLCRNCKNLEPDKANNDPAVAEQDDESGAMNTALKQCAICDLHGFLVQTPSISRASCVEFAWSVGLGERSHRSIHTHARHAVGRRSKPEAGSEDEDGESETPAMTSQMVYHRPTRSGQYAFATVFAPWAIGLNRYNYSYAIGDDDRRERYKFAMRAYQYMFWRPEGAMTTTRLAHVQGFEGAVVLSQANSPVPVLSALTDGYLEELEKLVSAVDADIDIHTFCSMSEFATLISQLTSRYEPYSLAQETKEN